MGQPKGHEKSATKKIWKPPCSSYSTQFNSGICRYSLEGLPQQDRNTKSDKQADTEAEPGLVRK